MENVINKINSVEQTIIGSRMCIEKNVLSNEVKKKEKKKVPLSIEEHFHILPAEL